MAQGTSNLNDLVHQSLESATRHAHSIVRQDGHWCGELKANATITAEYVFLYQALGLDISRDRDALCQWLLSEQQVDGSWTIAPYYPGDVSTTVEVYLALKILNIPTDHPAMIKARDYVINFGGVEKVRIFTRFYLAAFGLFPWDALPELPAELILMPTWAPINIYRFSSWARSTIVPLLIVSHHKPIYPLPNGVSSSNDFLDELWYIPRNKGVPYSMPLTALARSDSIAFLFAAIDVVLSTLKGLRWMPTRGWARTRCLQWIFDHQEAEGDWAGIFPPMHFGLLALNLEGYSVSESRMRRGLEAIERFAWQDTRGKRIQSCVSPVWDTVLMSIGLCDAQITEKVACLDQAMDWVKSRQLTGSEGDWKIYRPHTKPGGFSFEYFNRWYPDVDDTAAAVIAFLKHDAISANTTCVIDAVRWMLGMQNRDGGWVSLPAQNALRILLNAKKGAFDVDNDYLFLNKIPFSDMNSLCDPSSADVTGRILEAFGLLVQNKIFRDAYIRESLWGEIQSSASRALSYIEKQQVPEGAWYGRWGANYIYGTSNVLCGLAYWRHLPAASNLVSPAVHWLLKVQDEEGGWGEALETYRSPTCAGIGIPTASQTAWALMGLLAHLPPTHKAIERGVEWLVSHQTQQGTDGSATWPEKEYTGTGFPNFFYIGYSLYPHCFPMMALGRYQSCMNTLDGAGRKEKTFDVV
ncbi:hypothetical protein ACLMJK_008217 [Lecanora helva]